MSALDAALLAAILVLGAWRVAAPGLGRRLRLWAALATAALAALQLITLGFTWQFFPGYLLLLVVATPWAPAGRAARIATRVGLVALVLAAAGPWLVRPVPQLPGPSGPYAVGTHVFRWVDAGRAETATADPADRRNVIVQVWYPAAPGAAGPGAPYLDGLADLPPRLSGLPRFIFRRFGQTDTHAVRDAPPARRTSPVVIFSPGYGAPRGFYSGLCADLASRGYIVLALDHPYEVAVTELADGRVAAPILPRDSATVGYMERQIVVRAADVRFVLDRLAQPGLEPVVGPMNRSRVAAIGHSFGGATSALVAGHDGRITAAANIDGAFYGHVAAEAFQGPFLLIQSDHVETGHSERFNVAAVDVTRRAAHGAWRFEIGRANHFSFTDTPLYFSPPGQWLLAQVIGGGRGAVDTQRTTADIVAAFLGGGDVQAAAARHPGVSGGRVR